MRNKGPKCKRGDISQKSDKAKHGLILKPKYLLVFGERRAKRVRREEKRREEEKEKGDERREGRREQESKGMEYYDFCKEFYDFVWVLSCSLARV